MVKGDEVCMSKKKVVLMLIIFLVIIGIMYIPVELPEHINDLPDGEYIIVKPCVVTGAEWVILGDQDGLYKNNSKEAEYVNLTGEMPTKKYSDNIAGRWADTYFICYVNYVGKSYLGEAYSDILNTYDVSDCMILGDISRENGWVNLKPKSYVCLMDLIEKSVEKPISSSLTFVD